MVKVPADWRIIKLGNCTIGSLSYGINAPAIPYNRNYPAYIRITDITEDGLYGRSDRKSVVTKEIERYALKQGDIVLARTGASVGKSYLYNSADGELVYAGFLIKASIDTSKYDPRYIWYQLQTKRYWDWIRATSMRSGQPGINGNEYASFLVPMPLLLEQKAIADTISTFDTYISDLTELIEKKKAIRDGVLEDLVSGKKRLDGFSRKWKTYPFSELFKLVSNNTLPRDKLSDRGVIGNIHYGDVLIKYTDVLTDEDRIPRVKDGICVDRNNLLRVNDVVLADTAEDETVGKVTQIGCVSIPLVGGLHTVICRPVVATAIGYLGYYMNSKGYHEQLIPYVTGIKVSAISKKSLKCTALTIPTDIKEQQAIADTLTAMDDEIRELEEERSKMKEIREGAMDDLLTGRVRLPL